MHTSIENIRAIQNHILFSFLDNTAGGVFTDSLSSGIQLPAIITEQGSLARWVKVLKVGPTVKGNIKEGDTILVEKGMWTKQLWLDDGTKIWKTLDKHVIGTLTDV